MALTLAKKELSSTDPVVANASTDYIELMRVENGVPTKHVKYPIYGEIEKTMARRTFDESGDYTIRPFPVQIIDHQGAVGVTVADTDTTITGTNTDFVNDFEVGDNIRLSSGTATANITSITNATSMVVNTNLGDGTSQTIFNNNRVSAALEPGKAYVKGYEFETIGVTYTDVKKGRGTNIATSQPINPNFGNNVKVTNVDFGSGSGMMFDPENLNANIFDMHCVNVSDINVTNQDLYDSTKIGTTKIRQIDYTSGTFTNVSTSNTAVFDAYLFDIQFSPISFQLGSSYTGNPPTSEYEMQTYVKDIKIAEDDEEECEEWKVPWTMLIRNCSTNSKDGKLTKEIFVHRFNPREDFWSDDPKYADIIGYVEQHYISPQDELKEYRKEYIKKGETHKCVGDFIHRDFSRQPYDPYKEYYEEEAS